MLTPAAGADDVARWVALHRECLARASGREVPEAEFNDGFRFALYDLAVNRIALSIAAHTFRHYAFMERLTRTLHHLIRLTSPA